jgi:two-component system cell cycle sensor histidine kinase/response regulator CckA
MKRVLIVEDKDENLYYLEALLTGSGCTVIKARHGAEALVLARQSPPDLVVSDLLMPVMDGYTLLRHWKADPRLRDAPFIVYTATYTAPEDEELAFKLGADAFILKPAEPDEFLAKLDAVQARVLGAPPACPERKDDDETVLKSYSETLIRKLEEKSLQLEEANRALQLDIAERTRTEAMLRESEERIREIAETIHEVFWTSDPGKTRFLYVSPAYEKVWGRSCASLYERPASWLEAIHPEDRDHVEEAARTRQVRGDYDEVYRIVQPDGAVRWIHDRAFPVASATGEILRVVGTAEDITERRLLEEQFRQAQKMEAIGQLAGGVAHDFNNLLAAIQGNVHLALTDLPDGHPVRANLEEIRKAGDRGSRLVQQILTFSRQNPQERRVVVLGPVLQEAMGLLRAIVPSTVELVTTIDPGAPAVLADPTQIHQVIVNLCTNAWHALEDRAGRIEVRLESVTLDVNDAGRLAGLRPGHLARISVTDTGKGMDPATLERAFEPFFTTKQPGKGTGLGLAVVHGVMQAHDGTIAVRSQPGHGSTFELYFPATSEPQPVAEAATSSPLRGRGQRILFLDDEEPLVFLGVRMLERQGYRVSGFSNVEDALSAFREDPGSFDLVVTDMSMIGATGLEVAAEMLALRPEIPIVLSSGHVTDELREKARDLGIREVLYKPTTMAEFGAAIARLIDSTV